MSSCSRLLIVSILLAFSKIAFSADTIILSNGATFPPMHTDSATGFVDLVLHEAFRRLGYNLKIHGLPNERSLLNANNGIIDGESQRIAGLDEKYPNLIRVPEKIMDWQFVAFSKKTISMTQGWSSLKGHTTAYINGWKIFEYNIPQAVEVKLVKHPQELFVLLHNDRTDLGLYELWQGLELLKQSGSRDIKAQTPPLAVREMFTYLHKKHKKLVPELARVLREMKNDGVYQDIYNRVLGTLEK